MPPDHTTDYNGPSIGGFLFYIPKWILMGTKGSRERKKILKQQEEILKRTGG